MLYVYEDKIYVMPFDYKMIEVLVTKKGEEYNVEATEKEVELTNKIKRDLYSVTVEKAYEMQNNRNKFSKKIDLD